MRETEKVVTIEEALRSRVRKIKGRPKPVDVRCRFGVDSADDPTIFVTVVLDDETTDEDWTTEKFQPISDALKKELHRLGVERWPSFSYATLEDLRSNNPN